MLTRKAARFPLAALALGLSLAACAAPGNDGGGSAGQPVAAPAFDTVGDGVVRVRSAYGVDETVARLKQDIAAKGIMFFDEIDQAGLAAGADIALRPSTLLLFGNPPLGTQFIAADPAAGLDWPVRLLVAEDAEGRVWAIYTDFDWIRRRHGIAGLDPQFAMAAGVAASITASVRAE